MSKLYNKSRSLSIDWVHVMEQNDKNEGTQSCQESEKEVVNTNFCTGSSYIGKFNEFGMTEHGLYHFPNGVYYEGELVEGKFHGKGCLVYPSGHMINGIWYNGQIQEMDFIFSDEIRFKTNAWKYCLPPDRRFSQCIYYGIPGIGESFITSYKPPRSIPKYCYDTEEGFYNSKTKCLHDPNDLNRVLRIPSKSEEAWIIKNCRKWEIESIGYNTEIIKNETTF